MVSFRSLVARLNSPMAFPRDFANPGSFFGPAAIHTLELQVEHLSEWTSTFLPDSMNLATALRPLAFGLVIVLFLMFEPRGIANWWRICRSYFKLWPFRY